MCGIVGYVGNRNALQILKFCLKRLEYRGYDSAGIAILDEDKIYLEKKKGYVDDIYISSEGTVGIGHTRWATHGAVEDRNAHPFIDCTGKFAIAHNGIIENYLELRKKLEKKHRFSSETDSEVIVHLIEEYYREDFLEAFMKAIRELEGSYAVVAIHAGERKILGAKKESPLVIGVGTYENFIASDIPAFLNFTNKVIVLNDFEICEVTDNNVRLFSIDGKEIQRKSEIIDWTPEYYDKGGYEHYMLKEIYEQPIALENTLKHLFSTNIKTVEFERVVLVGCGSSYHAALVGKYLFEKVAEIPAECYHASEYRYRKPIEENVLVILITQSGETADTIASAKLASKYGLRTLGLTNVMGSSITRHVGEVLYTFAGPELGVAATKTFIVQIATLHYMAINYAYVRGKIQDDEKESMINLLRRIPRYIERTISLDRKILEISELIYKSENMFYIGRGINYPIALEGALKMKEISYIHAEAYPGGELKHGPLALITSKTPVVALAPHDETYPKIIGNIKEVNARGAPVIGISDNNEIKEYVDVVLNIPKVEKIYSIYPATVALQLLAYHTAKLRGCEIDRPRNLAKSVTVE